MKKETSYGIIPLRQENSTWQVLLIKHQAGHWSFPKGHPEPDEPPLDAAIRELKEETGLTPVKILFDEPLIENYHFRRKEHLIDKTVAYYIAQVQGDVILQLEELSDSKWVPLEEATNHVTFPEAKRLTNSLKHRFSAQGNGG